jgi:hypothetical protein
MHGNSDARMLQGFGPAGVQADGVPAIRMPWLRVPQPEGLHGVREHAATGIADERAGVFAHAWQERWWLRTHTWLTSQNRRSRRPLNTRQLTVLVVCV